MLCLEIVLDVKWGFLCGCHCPIRDGICSPAVGVEALWAQFDQTPLPLFVCLAPKEMIAKAREAHVVTANLCAACVGICRFHPEETRGCIPFSVVFVPNLVQGYGVQ